jgi:hypothetical protein
MKLIDSIAKFMDFDRKKVTDAVIVTEFQHKYQHTIVKINNIYHTIQVVDDALLYAQELETGMGQVYKEIDSIESVNPPTGLYASEHGLLYLSRLPYRQWKKSLFVGENYNITVLKRGKTKESPNLVNTVFSKEHEYQLETIKYEDEIWLGWIKVGVFDKDDGIIRLEKPTFKEEITELWTQYPVILGLKPQPKPMDVELMLDF